MNAEDCPRHAPQIDKTVFYPWICPCEPDPMLFDQLVQCVNCEGCFPLLGDGSPQDEGFCPVCWEPVENV